MAASVRKVASLVGMPLFALLPIEYRVPIETAVMLLFPTTG